MLLSTQVSHSWSVRCSSEPLWRAKCHQHRLGRSAVLSTYKPYMVTNSVWTQAVYGQAKCRQLWVVPSYCIDCMYICLGAPPPWLLFTVIHFVLRMAVNEPALSFNCIVWSMLFTDGIACCDVLLCDLVYTHMYAHMYTYMQSPTCVHIFTHTCTNTTV